jgi:putative DNA primase/helicase
MFMNEFRTENDLLASALAYASLGYRVLPCHSAMNGICTCGGRSGCKPGKHPLTAHGCHDGTTDAKTIRQWWQRWPWANVAIATGGDLFVWDVDPRHGGDSTMTTLVAQNGALPSTPTVATGGGGNQFYLRYPPGIVIGSRGGVAEGIDTRGDSGYVIAPPSVHLSGLRYEWITPLDTTPAETPYLVVGDSL